MTDDQTALFRTIRENPDLNAPRLVYADWLEENGNADRAAFIRLQCELEHLDPYSVERFEAEREEERLLRKFGRRWVRQDAQVAFPGRPLFDDDALWISQPRFRFRRGFIDFAEFRSPIECVAALPRLSARTPLTGLRLGSPYTESDTEQEWFDNTYHTVYSRSIGHAAHMPEEPGGTEFPPPDEFRRLLHSPVLAPIRSFTMDTLFIDRRHLEVLAASPLARQLRHLDLSGNICVVPGDWAALTATPAFAGLQSLRLDGSRLSPVGLAALLSTPHLGSLRQLSMEGPSRLPAVGPEGIRALCDSPNVPNLRELNLRGQYGGAAGLRALAAWPGLKNLTRLDLSYFYSDQNTWDDFTAAWGDFARSPNWGELRELDLEGDSVEHLEAILDSPNLSTLRILTFANAFLRYDGLEGEHQQNEAASLLVGCPNLSDELQLRMPAEGLSTESVKRLRDRLGARLQLFSERQNRQPGDWSSGRTTRFLLGAG